SARAPASRRAATRCVAALDGRSSLRELLAVGGSLYGERSETSDDPVQGGLTMKRTFLAVLSAALLLVVVPSVASAHHSKHHAACRAGTHKHHAKCARARAHVLSFGPTFSAPGAPAGAPAGSPPSGETAGTVTSYIAPILTITLNDKKTEVSGKVTEN